MWRDAERELRFFPLREPERERPFFPLRALPLEPERPFFPLPLPLEPERPFLDFPFLDLPFLDFPLDLERRRLRLGLATSEEALRLRFPPA